MIYYIHRSHLFDTTMSTEFLVDWDSQLYTPMYAMLYGAQTFDSDTRQAISVQSYVWLEHIIMHVVEMQSRTVGLSNSQRHYLVQYIQRYLTSVVELHKFPRYDNAISDLLELRIGPDPAVHIDQVDELPRIHTSRIGQLVFLRSDSQHYCNTGTEWYPVTDIGEYHSGSNDNLTIHSIDDAFKMCEIGTIYFRAPPIWSTLGSDKWPSPMAPYGCMRSHDDFQPEAIYGYWRQQLTAALLMGKLHYLPIQVVFAKSSTDWSEWEALKTGTDSDDEADNRMITTFRRIAGLDDVLPNKFD